MKLIKTPKYKSVKYDEKKYSKGINTSYYDKAIKDYKKGARADRNQQLKQAEKTRQDALKQAYIQNVQNTRALNNSLATAGIRGGATETSQLGLMSQYGAARGQANTDYANTALEINSAYNQNIRDYTADMKSRAEEYRQNQMNARWQAAREDAANKYNALRENALNEYNAQNEFWNGYYGDYYSGSKKKNLNKYLKQAKKNRSKAKGYNKLQYYQQIRGIQQRRGAIANKAK